MQGFLFVNDRNFVASIAIGTIRQLDKSIIKKVKIMSKRQNFMLSPHFSYEEMTRSKWAEDHHVENTPDELQLAGKKRMPANDFLNGMNNIEKYSVR